MAIKSKVSNDKYREEWDKIFGNKKSPENNSIVNRNRELISGKKKEDRSTFEYPPIDNPEYDKPTTYKEDQKH